MSSAGVAKKIAVHGWDPVKKEELVGKAESMSSQLGDKTGDKAVASAFGDTAKFEVDHPVFSVEEANAIAEAKLTELLNGYIQGEGECSGNPNVKAGIVVKITVNADKESDKFNGKYFITGTSHVYTHGGEGGYRTMFCCRRDAEGG